MIKHINSLIAINANQTEIVSFKMKLQSAYDHVIDTYNDYVFVLNKASSLSEVAWIQDIENRMKKCNCDIETYYSTIRLTSMPTHLDQFSSQFDESLGSSLVEHLLSNFKIKNNILKSKKF